MRIYGYTTDFKDRHGKQYRRYPGEDKPVRYVHKNLWLGCECCFNEYLHWLCDDRGWRLLPKYLQDCRLCLNCYRFMKLLQKKGVVCKNSC